MLSAAQITSSFGGRDRRKGERRPREMRVRLRDITDAVARSHCFPLSSDRNNEGGRRRGRGEVAGSTLLRLWADGDAPHFWEGGEQCSKETGYFCFRGNRNSAFLAVSANNFGLSDEIRHFGGKLFRPTQQFFPILAEIFQSCRNSVEHWARSVPRRREEVERDATWSSL